MVFLNQCVKYTSVFNYIFELSKSKDNVRAMLEEVKKKKLNSHRSKICLRKKLLKNLMEQLNLLKNLSECNLIYLIICLLIFFS